MLLSEKGIGPTESKVKALVEARESQTQSEVRSFLGLANFSARFIPNFATIAEPLRQLTHKNTTFRFGTKQKKSFQQLQLALGNAKTLAYFDKNAPTEIIADASPVGLGAVLVQKQQEVKAVVAYASKSLSYVERRDSQTEKKSLGLVWACEKFHPYINLWSKV